ncbi:MAG: YncE family protein [Myxococcota bacterium]
MVDRRRLLAGIGAAAVVGPRVGRAGSQPLARLPLPDWPGQVVEPLAVFRCGPQPKGIAVSPDGTEVWVTFLDGPPSVGVYALPYGEELATISLGDHGAVEAAFRCDGRTVWVSQMETHSVHEIDAATFVVRRWFDTESNWSKVIEPSPDGSRLYVSNWNFHDVSEIDLGLGETIRRLPTTNTPRGLHASADGRSLYVAGFGDGTFERVSLDDGSRTALFVGDALRHVVAAPGERHLYVTDMGGRCVWRYTPATGAVTKLATTDANPNTAALTPDGRVLCVSNRGPNGGEGYLADGPAYGSVLVIDAADGTVLDSIVGGDQCTALALTPDGQTLVFSDFRDDTIRVYRVPPYDVLKAAGWPRRDLHARDLRKRH